MTGSGLEQKWQSSVYGYCDNPGTQGEFEENCNNFFEGDI
jgi:hypothetical protein